MCKQLPTTLRWAISMKWWSSFEGFPLCANFTNGDIDMGIWILLGTPADNTYFSFYTQISVMYSLVLYHYFYTVVI